MSDVSTIGVISFQTVAENVGLERTDAAGVHENVVLNRVESDKLNNSQSGPG